MSAFAAVMTGRGSGAIATIQLFGDAAEVILTKLFQGTGKKPVELATGRILLGHIFDGDEAVDQVTIGCESPGVLAIHCHGNPLIVERIMGALQQNGVELLTVEEMLAKMLAAQSFSNTIAAEAKLALTTVKTVAGAEILAHQIESGLSAKVGQWRRELDTTPFSQIVAEAEQILRDSEPARLLISGCTIALIGPPNTGKSTLLNTLAGREKAIVTDIRGTTRDWVSAEIHIPPLAATIIDTAGLDPSLAVSGEIDQAAQQKSIEIIDRADLVLLILDASQPASQVSNSGEIGHRGHGDHRVNTDASMDATLSAFSVSSVPSVAKSSQASVPSLWDKLAGKKTIVVLNKADLPEHFQSGSLPPRLGQPVRLSAKQGTGIEDLIHAIHRACNLTNFNVQTAIVFTDRQRILMRQLASANSRHQSDALMAELLHGPIE